MFISDQDLVEVKVYSRKIKSRYISLTDKEYEKLKVEDKPKYELLTVKLREMTWGLYNQLQDDAMVDSGNGDQRFNYRIYKENRLKKLIKEWDAKDKDGKVIAVSEQVISHLAPSVAEAILKAYDEVSFLGDEEAGK